MAAKEGPVEIVECLVERASVNIKDDDGVNILLLQWISIVYFDLIEFD